MFYPFLRKAGVELTRIRDYHVIYSYSSKQIENALRRLEVAALKPSGKKSRDTQVLRHRLSNNIIDVGMYGMIRWENFLLENFLGYLAEIDNGKRYTVEDFIEDNWFGDLLIMEFVYRRKQPRSKEVLLKDAKYQSWLEAHRHLFIGLETDQDCWELPSQPLTNWEDLRQFFHLGDAYLESIGGLRSSEYVTGTGGHIHMEVSEKEAFKVKQHLLNHPWVMMAFADPRDDQHPLENVAANRVQHLSLYSRWKRGFSLEKARGMGRRLVAWRDPTIEWRLFDIAQTWEMQEEHMAFAQAFTEYAIKTPGPSHLLTADEIVAMSEKDLIAGFKKTIETLELPWKRYKDYVENIRTRLFLKTDKSWALEQMGGEDDRNVVTPLSSDNDQFESLCSFINHHFTHTPYNVSS